MLTLYLVRHGETDYNAEGRLQGQLPVPLNARGRAQAEKLARRLDGAGLDAIWSSDLPRALQTAEIVAETQELKIETHPGFRERRLGHWQGQLYREVKKELDDARWVSHQDGETPETMRARVWGALETLTEAHDGQAVLLVAHGGSCHTILSEIAGPDYGHAFHTWHNTAISTLAWDKENGWRVIDLYDDTHLEGDCVSFAEATK